MELKFINKVLADLVSPDNASGVKFLEKQSVKELNGEEQGEYGEYYKIYSTPEPEVFLKVTYRTDSYGSNDFVQSAQFVKVTEKKVTVYESI